MTRVLASVCVVCMLVTVTLRAGVSENGLSGQWVGSADLWGQPVLIEIEIQEETGTLNAFGEAPLSFDARVLAGGSISKIKSSDEVRFALGVGRVTYEFEGTRVGGVLAGKLKGEGPASWLRCFRIPQLKTADLDRLVGLYEGDGERVLVTWREYGNLRAIDLDSGENHTLIPLNERAFLTHRQILEDDTDRPTYRFPRGESGTIVALVRGAWENPSTLERTERVIQERIRFQSGGVELAGTLLLPPGKNSAPAVVLVHGSGPIYRTALIQRSLLFVESGLAALVYDKRGTGASQGDRQDDKFDVLIGDVQAAVRAVRRHAAVDAKRIGLQGHSQAGFLIPVVAAEDPSIAFAIVVNGGSIRPGEQSLYDKQNDLLREGFSDQEREEALSLMRRFFAYVRDREGDRATLERDYLAAKSAPWFTTTDLPDIPGIPSWDNPPTEMMAFAEQLQFDPVPYQNRMFQPVLVLLGEMDKTVPAQIIGEAWQKSLRSGGNPRSRVEVISGANHGMKLVTGPTAGEMSPCYIRLQQEWLGSLIGSDQSDR